LITQALLDVRELVVRRAHERHLATLLCPMRHGVSFSTTLALAFEALPRPR
jgi:hypothetical protein